jgi:hypothetical protein
MFMLLLACMPRAIHRSPSSPSQVEALYPSWAQAETHHWPGPWPWNTCLKFKCCQLKFLRDSTYFTVKWPNYPKLRLSPLPSDLSLALNFYTPSSKLVHSMGNCHSTFKLYPPRTQPSQNFALFHCTLRLCMYPTTKWNGVPCTKAFAIHRRKPSNATLPHPSPLGSQTTLRLLRESRV